MSSSKTNPSFLSFFLLLISLATISNACPKSFLQCLYKNSESGSPIFQSVHTAKNSTYNSTLLAYIRNKQFSGPNTPKPFAIITAKNESHIRSTIQCAKQNGMQVRIRSGGHDYEGLSYTSNVPFVIIDLFDLFSNRSFKVDVDRMSAWVPAGMTTGELYYQLGMISNDLAFPAGVCLYLGLGGHISGGGYGNLMRKYGLSSDNVLDAQIIDVNGRVLSRKTMGEDLFWAIRGGGAANFGVVLQWNIRLVRVPEIVTVFNIDRKVSKDGIGIDVAYKWQHVASTLPDDLFIRVQFQTSDGEKAGEKIVTVHFIGQFLGRAHKLVSLLKEKFPELGLRKEDCIETSWVNSTLFWNGGNPLGTPLDVLRKKPTQPGIFFKSKSDYVKSPIPKSVLKSISKKMLKTGVITQFQWNPYGGAMARIPADASPYPHRAGNLFSIQYFTMWFDESENPNNHVFKTVTKMYNKMTPYVSKNPRESFVNYRDLDIGSNPSNVTNLKEAAIYGTKYFKGNYNRLTQVKAKVDPENFFRFEQSIPPIWYN